MNEEEGQHITYFDSPIGIIEIKAGDEGITSVLFAEKEKKPTMPVTKILQTATRQIEEYFEGKRELFDLPLEMKGTELQKEIWKQLLLIPYGKTVSYSDIALAVSSPDSARAVGNITGKNNLLILVPCHRVIAKNRNLTGYKGGLQRKKWLLDFEKNAGQLTLF